MFSGDPAPFVMELPAYHMPTFKGVMIHMWERGRAFIIKAGTIIFSACLVLWFMSAFSWSFEMVDLEESILASIGNVFAWIFAPLGFGDWKGAVSVVSAELAKEQAIGTLAMLGGAADPEDELMVMESIQTMFTPMAAFSFMVLNLFDPPCLVAIATVIREMNSKKWAAFAIGYQVVIGYATAFICYQLGSFLFFGAAFGLGQGIAILVLLWMAYMIFRPEPKENLQPASEKV